MTPAEMREMAAKACDKVSDGDEECLNQAPDEMHWHYHTGGRDASEMCARIIRAIPIPDTTAADDAADAEIEKIMEMTDAEVDSALHAEGKDPEKVAADMRKTIDRVLVWHDTLEKAREALEPFASDEASDWDMTVPDGYRPASGHWVCRLSTGDFRRACEALAAIDAAKAKGG